MRAAINGSSGSEHVEKLRGMCALSTEPEHRGPGHSSVWCCCCWFSVHTSADLCYVLCALQEPMRCESSSVVGSLPVSDVTVTVVMLVHRWGHSKFKTLKVRGKCEAKRAAPRLILPNALPRQSRSWKFEGPLLKRSRPVTMRSVRSLCQRLFVQLPMALRRIGQGKRIQQLT